MESLNNDYEGNRKTAENFIGTAIKKGAKLILLPEFVLAGNIYADDIWQEAEPLQGRTSQWLGKLCDQYNAYIATCILEQDGEDFYDTFILCGPDRKMWSHRKVEPAGYEAFFFRGAGPNECVFDTPIGKIGVTICFDASKAYSLKGLSVNQPDLILIPFSCPNMPDSFPQKYRENWVETYHSIPATFAKHLRVPVVSSNKTGDFLSPMPMGVGMQYRARYIDRISIVDRNGSELSVVDGKPGIAFAEVEIKSSGASMDIEIPRSRWFLPVSWVTRFTSGGTQLLGKIRYAISRKRRNAASQVIMRN